MGRARLARERLGGLLDRDGPEGRAAGPGVVRSQRNSRRKRNLDVDAAQGGRIQQTRVHDVADVCRRVDGRRIGAPHQPGVVLIEHERARGHHRGGTYRDRFCLDGGDCRLNLDLADLAGDPQIIRHQLRLPGGQKDAPRLVVLEHDGGPRVGGDDGLRREQRLGREIVHKRIADFLNGSGKLGREHTPVHRTEGDHALLKRGRRGPLGHGASGHDGHAQHYNHDNKRQDLGLEHVASFQGSEIFGFGPARSACPPRTNNYVLTTNTGKAKHE